MSLKHFFAKTVSIAFKSGKGIPIDSKSFQKILVVRQHDQLGDMMCVIPLLHALRENFPASHITLIASPVNAEVMENHPYINEILCYDKKKYWKSPITFLRFLHRLRRFAFDIVIVPVTVSLSMTSDLLALVSGAGVRIGAASLSGRENPCKSFFTHPVVLSWDGDPYRHQTQRNMDILRPLKISCDDLSYVIGFTEKERQSAEEKISSLRKNKKYIIGMHPGAGKPPNRWKPEYFADIARRITRELDASVIITVGHMDDEPFSRLKSLTDCPYEVIYKKPLREVASVIDNFDLFITNDTGIMHVAAATRTRVIALFGMTDPVQWAPKGPKVRYISMPDGNINSISVEHVWREIVLFLSKIA